MLFVRILNTQKNQSIVKVRLSDNTNLCWIDYNIKNPTENTISFISDELFTHYLLNLKDNETLKISYK